MPLRPTAYGFDIELIRSDGSLRVIAVYRGREQLAFKKIMNYRRTRPPLLTDREAAQALCGLNQITLSRPQPVKSRRSLAAAFVARVERLFVKIMRFDEACEMGGSGK